MSFKCDLCNVELKKYYFENVRTICGKCHYKQECAEDIKHELLEQKAKTLIPADYKFDIADLRHNKYCYRQALIRIQCNIPQRIINMAQWQLSQEINKIKLELNNYIIKDLIKLCPKHLHMLSPYNIYGDKIIYYYINVI